MAATIIMLSSLTVVRGLEFGLPVTAALAAIALIGYLFGRRTRQADQAEGNARRLQELERASGIAHQLENIADALRQDLASHHSRLSKFRKRLGDAQDCRDEQTWKQLCAEAESMLSPTMQLAEQLSLAYDSIRQQSDALETFAEARTDRLTGVGNSRALEAKLEVLITAAKRNVIGFSIALVSLDRDYLTTNRERASQGPSPLPEFAKLIQSCMRDNDYVARYGDDEFVVVMPQTTLAGACVFAERLLERVIDAMGRTASCGLAEFKEGDDARVLLGRADSAYYSAKAAGGNRQFAHSGTQIREHRNATPAIPGRNPDDSLEADILAAASALVPFNSQLAPPDLRLAPLDGAADCFLASGQPATQSAELPAANSAAPK
jgi:diguanylate cyclase